MSDTGLSELVIKHFAEIKDPRIDRKKLYPLMEILFVVLCGTICGAESWRDFVLFGKEKIDFLSKYFPFENGVPSKNTFARLFANMDSSAFKSCFLEWMKSLHRQLQEVIAFDGKTLRHSFDRANNQSAIHMVSAYATEARLVLGQIKVDEKSNEITAIPLLLDLLELTGTIVTIDAMGCQKEIAKKIIEKQADYVLSLKGNHSRLHEEVKLFLESEVLKTGGATKLIQCFSECDKGHGRIEIRRCFASDDIDWLEQKLDWVGLKSVAMVEEERRIKGKISVERRFFITSLAANPEQIARAIRAHWGVETSLHWTLDMTFREDESRVRLKNAAENMAIIRHMALNMLQNAKKAYSDTSIRGLRKKAGWGDGTLDFILKQQF